jgi:hypothetical protein
MNKSILPLVFILIIAIFLAGCTSSELKFGNSDQNAASHDSETKVPAAETTLGKDQQTKQQNTNLQETIPVKNSESDPDQIVKVTSKTTHSSNMAGFVSSTFPLVTDIYSEIKKSRNALEWKEVQDKALNLQLQIQEIKKTYQLDIVNPEKKVFPNLNSKEQIVFLKYLGYLNDMENYAANLKNAVYYQEKSSDAQSAQTARRYQSLADQFEKEAIAKVKTISTYCNDYKFTFFDMDMSKNYRYI